MKLIQFRNDYEAFNGVFEVMNSSNEEVRLRWDNNGKYCELFIELMTKRTTIQYIDENNDLIEYIV